MSNQRCSLNKFVISKSSVKQVRGYLKNMRGVCGNFAAFRKIATQSQLLHMASKYGFGYYSNASRQVFIKKGLTSRPLAFK